MNDEIVAGFELWGWEIRDSGCVFVKESSKSKKGFIFHIIGASCLLQE